MTSNYDIIFVERKWFYMGKFVDLKGQKFGRLTVIKKTGTKNRKAIWKCKCDCGEYREVPTCHLKSGHTTSCGCYHSEISKLVNTTHGGRKDRLYTIWADMRKRCYSKNEKSYKNYGGRGIIVCNEWLGKDGYKNFREWAYESGYDKNSKNKKCTLDRIDVNGNYEPNNCRWADMGVQNRNKRDNVLITYNGVTKVLKDWSKEFGVPVETIRYRLSKGIDIEHLFDKRNFVSITYNGETKPITEWAKEKEMDYNTILKRYRRGLTPEQIFDKSKIKK